MSNQLARKSSNFLISINSFDEGMRYCEMISRSSFCPDKMKGKPGDIFIAIQMGAEIGLSPMQAIQNIAIIGGRPLIWGDAALAVCQSSPYYINHREWFEGKIEDESLTAYTGMTRKNSEEHIKSFSIADAKRALLWKKPGCWQQYPERMLQMRARGYAMRDKFSDALKGMNIAEEFIDTYDADISYDLSSKKENHAKKAVLTTEDKKIEQIKDNLAKQCEGFLDDLEQAETMEELNQIWKVICKMNFKESPSLLSKLINAKDKKKDKLKECQEDLIESDVSQDAFMKAYDAAPSNFNPVTGELAQ